MERSIQKLDSKPLHDLIPIPSPKEQELLPAIVSAPMMMAVSESVVSGSCLGPKALAGSESVVSGRNPILKETCDSVSETLSQPLFCCP